MIFINHFKLHNFFDLLILKIRPRHAGGKAGTVTLDFDFALLKLEQNSGASLPSKPSEEAQ